MLLKTLKISDFSAFLQNPTRLRTSVRALVRTCKEPQKFIKFSAFSGIYFYKFSPIYRERGPQKILLYFWGEGANEQKTNKWIKRVCLVKSEICDAYTRIFGTRQEPQKFIEFSDSSGNILIKFSPFYRNCIYSVQGTLCHCEERSDVAISRKGYRFIKSEKSLSK